MASSFLLRSSKLKLKNKSLLKKWISEVIAKENKKEGKLIFLFCTDKELHSINKEFLNHDTYTDIITFDYTEGEKISGEIYISTERVEENANKFGVAFETELHRVIVHGVLHLCGYKDKSIQQKNDMRAAEEKSLLLLSTISKTKNKN